MGMLDDVKAKKKQKAAENWMKMADTAKTIDKQIEYYTKSLDIDPYNAEAWFKKGRALEKMERFEEAKKSFDLAIEIDPDYQGLINKKYKPSSSSILSFDEDPGFTSDVPVKSISDETDDEEEWIIETPGAVSTEKEELQREGGTSLEQENAPSFKPPVGDESIFSSSISGESEDYGAFSKVNEDIEEREGKGSEEPEGEVEEKEDVFGSEVSSFSSEPENLSGSSQTGEDKDNYPTFTSPDESGLVDETVDKSDFEEGVADKREDTFSATPTSVAEKTDSFSSDENVIGNNSHLSSEAPEFLPQASPSKFQSKSTQEQGYNESSDAIVGQGDVTSSGAEIVDIRIPLNETIKFWAIGIVAMLIVLILSKVL